ncbi:hypothetical protein AVEN_142049-1 [Araneus ventricosus]|uniref:Uncharacterized protein n=1 Tax=Araneus ventricosus TaxID=182803 RepID=A0A4Y2K289_ARAVE|nr:hypothetical protein AVEN_142049-1 [Araneus ventricosus]
MSTHRTLPYSKDRPVRCCNICSFYGCHLLARKLRMAQLWLIPIYAERRWCPGGTIAASTCVDVLLCVTAFGLPDLLATVTEPDLLNFMISFATCSWDICALCIALKASST